MISISYSHKSYEGLTKLDKIPKKDFRVYCLPMKIEELDAFSARILVKL